MAPDGPKRGGQWPAAALPLPTPGTGLDAAEARGCESGSTVPDVVCIAPIVPVVPALHQCRLDKGSRAGCGAGEAPVAERACEPVAERACEPGARRCREPGAHRCREPEGPIAVTTPRSEVPDARYMELSNRKFAPKQFGSGASTFGRDRTSSRSGTNNLQES